MSIIFNCTELLPDDKQKRKIDQGNKYNPNDNITPYPIFILRKCRGSREPCRIYIDHMARVYKTFKEYIEKNKLPKCTMTVPVNGR